MSKINYAFGENKSIQDLKDYVDGTYSQHYAKSKYQATEFIVDCGHGPGFCLGNILKYAQRYGRKGGKNRADLMKILHYGIIMLHVHDMENEDEVK
jgi:hypothetical protein